MANFNDLSREVQGLIKDMSKGVEEMTGESITPEDTLSKLEGIGFNVDGIDDSDAKSAREAMANEDMEAYTSFLESAGIAPAIVDQFRQQYESQKEASEGNDEGEGKTEAERLADDLESSDSPSPDDPDSVDQSADIHSIVQREVNRAVPTADEIARELRSQMSGDAPAPQTAQGGNDDQRKLAFDIARYFLQSQGSGGGGGAFGEFGEQLAKTAVEDYVRKLNQPSFEDMVMMNLYEDLAPEYAAKVKEDMFNRNGMVPGRDDGGSDDEPGSESVAGD